jgi:hypothetical protein
MGLCRGLAGSRGSKRTAPSIPPVSSHRPATVQPMYCGSRTPDAPPSVQNSRAQEKKRDVGVCRAG